MKYYCISLRQTPRRKEEAMRQFNKLGLTVTMIDGIQGRIAGLNTFLPYWNKKAIPETSEEEEATPSKDTEKYINSGTVGCHISHVFTWHVIKHTSNEEEVMIFEDDVVLPDDFNEQFHLYYEHLPEDWEFCYAGNSRADKYKAINDHIGIAPNIMGLQSYFFKTKIVDKLIERSQSVYIPIDWLLCKTILTDIPYYMFAKSLTSQKQLITDKGMWRSNTVWRGPEKGMLNHADTDITLKKLHSN